MAPSQSQLTVVSSGTAGLGSSQSSFQLQNFQEDCDSEYLEALEAMADAETDDGEIDDSFVQLVAEAERLYPQEVMDEMIQDLKQRGMVHFVQTYVLQRRADVKVLLIALDVCLPRELLRPEIPDTKLIPILKSALSRILRKRERLTQYSTPEDVVELLRKSRKIILLTGAGISVSVGIPDFRSKDGIYAQLQREGKYHLDDPTDMFDKRFFQQDPTCFYDFVHSLWPSEFVPSPTHFFIKLLEQRGQLLRDYTQNIDTLEHQAGITRVLACHGSFATASCTEPGCSYRCRGEDISSAVFDRRVPLCPRCNAPLIDDDDEEEDRTDADKSGRSKSSTPRLEDGKAEARSQPRLGKKKPRKKERGWGPGESEEDDAEDEVWVQGGRAGVGLSATHAPTEVLGQPSAASNPAKSSKDAAKRPLRRSASGKLIESPLQAGEGSGYRNWKGVIKPDVVFFGEKLPDDFDKLLLEDRDQVDLLVVIGTSLKVAPVSELVSHIPHSTPVVLINRTPVTHIAMDVQLLGNADDIIGWLCRRLGWELPGPHSVKLPPKSPKQDVVPPSQPEEKWSRGDDGEIQPRRAGTSPIWLWPHAQGGRVVDLLEDGARMDEFGRIIVGFDDFNGEAMQDFNSGDTDDDDEDDGESEDEGGDDRANCQDDQSGHGLAGGPTTYAGLLQHLYDRPATPEMRYLPPGVVQDSQASTSPSLSYVSASRLAGSPPPMMLNTLSSDTELAPDLLSEHSTETSARQAILGQAPSINNLTSNMTEVGMQMRKDSAVGDAPEQYATDVPVPSVTEASVAQGDPLRRPRGSDDPTETPEAASAAKRVKYDVSFRPLSE
ncbi:NAD-dependent histone deacetylase sir2 [Tilletia horrida]|uniref:NAD-dependent histone deacetylase sir2 n=1 Tax=Tilletia horrida TaxID=155126 RepID=A0AAN6GUU4_9BASI|nr:NAD-dependent histone deacetylase sir2 [Tilletia horrida]